MGINLKKIGFLVFFFLILGSIAVFNFFGDNHSGSCTNGKLFAQKPMSMTDIKKRFLKDKGSILRTKSEIKNLMNKIIYDLKKRNLSYKVKITNIMKYKIAEITGATVPEDMDHQVKVQGSLGDELWNQYMKRYRRSRRYRRWRQRRQRSIDAMERSRKRAERLERRRERRWREYLRREKNRKRRERELAREKERKRKYEKYRQKKLADEMQKKKEFDRSKKNGLVNAPSPNAKYFTWKDQKKVSPIKHQGTCGSCWAFTTTAVYEAGYMIRGHKLLDLSEQNVIDCAVGRGGRDAGSCSGGWYGTAFDYYRRKGFVGEKKVPYLKRNSYCKPSFATKYRVAAWGYVKRNAGIPSVREMKKALCKYGPIAATVKVTPAFQAYAGGVFDEFTHVSGPRDINHAITIVGWDDNRQAYLIKNSWGTGWGNKGYMWIKYGCNNIGYGAAWLVVEAR